MRVRRVRDRGAMRVRRVRDKDATRARQRCDPGTTRTSAVRVIALMTNQQLRVAYEHDLLGEPVYVEAVLPFKPIACVAEKRVRRGIAEEVLLEFVG